MKKVLLATTILGMTAGFAAAEIAFTGEAAAGFAQNGTNAGGKTSVGAGAAAGKTPDNTINPYATFKLSIAATGESDSGLSFGVSTSIESGLSYAMADDDGFGVKTGAMGAPTVFVSGDFGKISVKSDGFKSFKADNAASEKYDLEYSHTIGGVSVALRTDLQGDNAATKGKSSLKLGYTINAIALGATYDEAGALWGVSAAYTMGAITATLATDNASVSSLKLAYAGANGISGDIKADSASAWEANAKYTANGLTIGAGTTSASKWKVTASYDLGGGLTAEAGANYTNDMFVGAKMKF